VSIRGVREVERLAAEAWPAAVVEELDGWRLRFNWGMTRRANSVWPNESDNRVPLLEKLEQVETYYARWGVPARYLICPAAQPVELDVILADRGYVCDARTCVQVAALCTVVACGRGSSRRGGGENGRTRRKTPRKRGPPSLRGVPAAIGENVLPPPAVALCSGNVMVGEQFEERWFEVYRDAEQVPVEQAELRRGILKRIGLRTGYGVCEMEGEPAAIGLGVLGGGWLGATRPEFRRRGAASAVLHALARWGETGGARRAYLQVMAGNDAALALYAGAGFRTLYHYHYREASTG
jgi:ribosomal protein S18 acetylase RimI-like enzyme